MTELTARRTQSERRAQTRGRLLDATIESLVEAGYAATTTRVVAERAGVSAGAQTHHFPRRVDLVAAAVERLTDQRITALREAGSTLPAETAPRVRALLDLLWADFSGPLFKVAVKLWVAADDDPELYERLVPLERVLARAIAEANAELAREIGHEDLETRFLAVLAAVRGLALTEAFEPRSRQAAGRWALVRPVLERMLLAP